MQRGEGRLDSRPLTSFWGASFHPWPFRPSPSSPLPVPATFYLALSPSFLALSSLALLLAHLRPLFTPKTRPTLPKMDPSRSSIQEPPHSPPVSLETLREQISKLEDGLKGREYALSGRILHLTVSSHASAMLEGEKESRRGGAAHAAA